MTEYTKEQIRERTIKFIAGAQDMLDAYAKDQGLHCKETLTMDTGSKNIRIVKELHGGRSAWAFVNLNTGDILKPASWKVPAKHARGSVLEDDYGVSKVGPYGPAYLRG